MSSMVACSVIFSSSTLSIQIDTVLLMFTLSALHSFIATKRHIFWPLYRAKNTAMVVYHAFMFSGKQCFVVVQK